MSYLYYYGDRKCENCKQVEFNFTKTSSIEVTIQNNGCVRKTERPEDKYIALTCAHCGLTVRKSLMHYSEMKIQA